MKRQQSFEDPLSTTFSDPDHSVDEERLVTIGISTIGRILVIAHTEYEEEIRIISARTATPSEQEFYEEGTSEGR